MKHRFLNFWFSLRKQFLIFFLTFINSLQSRGYQPASTLQLNDFINSGFFYKSSEIDFGDIYRAWEFADHLWRVGEYRKAVEIRKNCLEDIYESEGVSDSEYAPPAMSVSWTSAFGHIGSLGVYSAAQRLGIISDQKKIVLVRNIHAFENIERIFKDTFYLVPSRYGSSSLEHPSQWHVSERLQVIKSKAGFICLYDLHDQVFSAANYSNILPKLDGEYLEFANQQLHNAGLPRDSWFATLHVRDIYGDFDTRSVNSQNFSDAVDEIIRAGGWVVQFGSNASQKLQPRKGLINLEDFIENHLYLHLYLLSQSRFLLTTNSGPSVIAWSFGTPVVQTNTTSIARNMMRASRNSLFLPKHYFNTNGRELTFREIAQGRLGYSENTTKELDKRGVRVLENSSEEILDATRDILGFLERGEFNSEFMEKLNLVRVETSAVGFGDVAPSFISKNPSWVSD